MHISVYAVFGCQHTAACASLYSLCILGTHMSGIRPNQVLWCSLQVCAAVCECWLICKLNSVSGQFSSALSDQLDWPPAQHHIRLSFSKSWLCFNFPQLRYFILLFIRTPCGLNCGSLNRPPSWKWEKKMPDVVWLGPYTSSFCATWWHLNPYLTLNT